MTEKRDPEFIDRLLDVILRRYSQVEPREGWEERMSARLEREAERPAGFPALRWAVAIVSVGVLVVAGVHYLGRSNLPSEPPQVVLRPPVAAPPAPEGYVPVQPKGERAAVTPSPGAVPSRVEAIVARPPIVVLPRRGRFPTREGLSEQERWLLLRAAEAEAEAGAEPQRPSLLATLAVDAPFEFEPVVIAPVTLDEVRIEPVSFN